MLQAQISVQLTPSGVPLYITNVPPMHRPIPLYITNVMLVHRTILVVNILKALLNKFLYMIDLFTEVLWLATH